MAEKTNSQQPAAAPQAAAKSNGISKIDGVKQALASLGANAKPLAIKDYLKTKLGIEISADVASNYKKTLAKRAKKGRRKSSAKAAAPAPKKVATPTAPKGTAPTGIALKDIETLKDLVGRVGAPSLRTLIDLLSR
jgi:hypothetical protein